MTLGPMAKCAHCGVLSVDEAMACEMGDCKIVDWHVGAKPKKPQPRPRLSKWAEKTVNRKEAR